MKLKISQNLPVSVTFEDKFGNTAQVDGLPSWAVTDEKLATLEVADDGMSAVVKPTGLAGSFKVQCSADGDLGEGVKSILGELDIDLLPGDATTVDLKAGDPVDAPVEEPAPAPAPEPAPVEPAPEAPPVAAKKK